MPAFSHKPGDPGVRPAGRAKKLIRAVVFTLLAADAVVLAAAGWMLGRSDCTIAETLAVARETQSRQEGELASRISFRNTEDGLDLWNTPEGSLWTVHGEKMLPFLLSEQQEDIYEPAGHEVRRGDVVLDCGANIGVFTRKALSRGAALVVAIEPAPQTLRALRRNFESEIQAGRVIVYPKGVWNQDAEMDLTLNPDNQGSNSVVPGERKRDKPTVRVPLTTIDRIVAELRLPRVDFIKMDIEGAEKPALEGARDTLRRFRPRMSLSSEHLSDDGTAIPALVKSIEPRYKHWGCDCVPRWETADPGGTASLRWLLASVRLRHMVLAFEPVP
jgi:FkbM family methyltransferase